jgi:hypothetical protein
MYDGDDDDGFICLNIGLTTKRHIKYQQKYKHKTQIRKPRTYNWKMEKHNTLSKNC